MRSLVRTTSAVAFVCLTLSPAVSAQDFPDDPPRVSTKSRVSPPSSASSPLFSPVAERRVRRPTLVESAPPSEILKFMENSLQVVADESKPTEVRQEFDAAFQAIVKAARQLLDHPQATEAQRNEAIQYQASVLYQGARMQLSNYSKNLADLANSLNQTQSKTDVVKFANFLAIKAKHETDEGLNVTALADIDNFIKRFPREEVAIDLLLDVANASELTGDYQDAGAALDKIKDQFRRHPIVDKIPGLLNRYNLVNKEMSYDFSEMTSARRMTPSSMGDKVIALHCWATWSEPCNQERENLKQLRKQYAGHFEVIGIPFDDKAEGSDEYIRKFVMEHQIPWPQATMPLTSGERGFNGKFARDYGIVALPTTILLNRDGRVVATNIRGATLRQKVESMLGRRAATTPSTEPRMTSRLLDDPPPPPK